MDDCPEIVVANSLALDFPNHSPVYLDVSQKVDARRISQRSCIEMPSIKDMELAALSLRVEVRDKEKRHLHTPFEIGRLSIYQSVF